MHYLFTDAETGGLDQRFHSLLTAYFGIYDENLNLIDDLDLKLKPDDISKLQVTKEALDVTGINIDEHLKDPNTITYSEGNKKVLELLERNKIKGKRKHFRPSGHNVGFDLTFYEYQLFEENFDDWRKTVHHNPIDTLRIVTFLQDVGLLPADASRLTDLVKFFGIPMGQAHNAREDIKMNVEVYRCLLKMFKDKKDSFSGISNHSLLEIVEK